MEIIGERWSLLVMRELMLGALRFSQIRANLPGISAKILTERLEKLELAGVLVRRMLPPPASVQVYELTEWGYEAEFVMQALGRWSVRSRDHDPTLPLTPVSAMLSLRTMIDPARAEDMDITVAFRFATDAFIAKLAGGELKIERAHDARETDLTFEAASPNAILPYFYGKRPLDEVEAETGLIVKGDRALADRFAGLFGLPSKFDPPAT
ncbi:transcriptional regulator [Croceicoccus sp. 1NDH52]|nr:winged helix-turn-helix transcriptional regulator [Croceicoccus gelatinilyticus]MBS7668914.1 transcriptional regulator [Croceicoccus gelatinilyticus]